MEAPSLKNTDYVGRAFGFVFGNVGSVFSTALTWLLPLLLIGLCPVYDDDGAYARAIQAQLRAAEGDFRAGPTLVQWVLLLSVNAFEMAMLAGFASQRHRQVLQPVVPLERSLRSAILPYVGYWLVATFVLIFLNMVIGFLLGLLLARITGSLFPFIVLAASAGTAIIVLRGVLVFPAIAVGDRGMTIEKSFMLTTTAIWRMALAAFLIVLPFLIVGLIAAVAWQMAKPVPSLYTAAILQFGILLLQFFSTAVFVTYISLVYAHMRGAGVPKPAH